MSYISCRVKCLLICLRIVLLFSFFVDDEERLAEELKDLIDDNPIEESEGEDSDASGQKRKKSDESDDDRLEEDDYDLLEENLGVKVERRVSF